MTYQHLYINADGHMSIITTTLALMELIGSDTKMDGDWIVDHMYSTRELPPDSNFVKFFHDRGWTWHKLPDGKLEGWTAAPLTQRDFGTSDWIAHN